MNNPDTLFVVVDHSAERYAQELLQHFAVLDPLRRFFGVGGDLVAAAGVELLEHSRSIGVVGILEVASSLWRLKLLQKRILKECHERGVRSAILIDYPDFNLRLAQKLSAMGIRVYYFVSPTVWAWRPGRIEWIRRYIRHLFLIYPFELDIYRKAGIHHVSYVGHPLTSKVKADLNADGFRESQGLPPSEDLLAVLPGSRLGEVRRHLPIMLQALSLLKTPGLHPVLLKADSIPTDLIQRMLGSWKNRCTVLPQPQGHNLISASRAVLSTCGTATLEIALLGTPFVVVYRVNPVSYFLGHRLIRIKRFSIVNILAERELVPELIQHRMTPENIAAALDHLLGSDSARSDQIKGFAQVSSLLDPSLNPAQRIANAILADEAEPGAAALLGE